METLVYELLAQVAVVPPGGLRPDHRLLVDLRVDGDDFGMWFVPELERRLGVSVPRTAWERVTTISDIVDVVHSHYGANA